MHLKRILLIGFIALGLSAAFSQKIQFEEYNLDNGMHVILHQDNNTPIVAISVLYHVGAKDEDPQRTGFAHFFEHLMFEGSPNIARGEYMKIVQGAGGELNANTGFDRTYYYEILPSNELELGLWMESERMFQLRVDSIGVETQRQVVKEERRMRYDNQPYGKVREEVFKRAYKVHPYQWLPIGSAQYIDQAQLSEFMDFYKKYYVPNNATLTIAGDFDVPKTKEMIKKYFGDIPRGANIPAVTAVEPPMTAEVKDSVFDKIQLPMVVLAYHTPEATHPDFPALEMMMTVLGDGESARLPKSLVDQQQKAVRVFAFPMDTEHPGLSFVQAVAQKGVTPLEVDTLMTREIERMKNELISEEEYQTVLNKLENDMVNSKASLAYVAEQLANNYVYQKGNTDLINTKFELYKKVTREDIQRVAKQYFDRNNRVNLYVLPKK